MVRPTFRIVSQKLVLPRGSCECQHRKKYNNKAHDLCLSKLEVIELD